MEKKRARLNWSSASEINASHFEIEKSYDADNFEKIGEVKAAGNSQTLLRYEFYDDKIIGLRSKHILYYRLKMVDLDGTIEYSDIRGLNFGNDQSAGVSMYPNPTSQYLNLDINKDYFTEENGELQVFDALGKLILSKKVIGSGIETIDMGRMTNGVYHVIFMHDDQIFSEKIVKID
ncbi:MAG: T9SS type A sorting domain-containing protein [Saprospiraceae bacterium]|nr:T9SS type A sorting domain-containing protein [Saprospiraceae bacterium]